MKKYLQDLSRIVAALIILSGVSMTAQAQVTYNSNGQITGSECQSFCCGTSRQHNYECSACSC